MDLELYIAKSQVEKLLAFTGSRQTLFNLEKAGKIPKSTLIQKGKKKVAHWKKQELPLIGKAIGYLKAPEDLVIICVFTEKGGVLKTSFTYNLARTLALCGINVLVCGLESQGSLTSLALTPMIKSLEDIEDYPCIYDSFYGKNTLKFDSILRNTDIDNMKIIPESPELRPLKNTVNNESMRHTLFYNNVLPQIKKRDFDVMIFDCGNDWNPHIENALYMSDYVISPIGCDPATFQAKDLNIDNISTWGEKVGKSWKSRFMVPVKKQNTNISRQIYAAYLSNYPEYFVEKPIRHSVTGDEAWVMGKSVSEYDPSSKLADDYTECIKDIWSKIIKIESKS